MPSVASQAVFCPKLMISCALRWVDEVVKDAPWVLDLDFINKHKIDYVTHDALPYSDASGQANDVYDFVSTPARLPFSLTLTCFVSFYTTMAGPRASLFI